MGASTTSSTLQQFFADLIHSATLRAHRQLVCIDYPLDFIVAAFDEAATPLVIGHADEGLSWRQARQKLGQECGHIVVEVGADFNAEAFCAIAGCCRAGSLILLRLAAPKEALPPSVRRLVKQLELNESVAFFLRHQVRRPAEVLPLPGQHEVRQENAIEAVKKVATGHRRRPLLLTADRGRGKSAALGIAVAQLVMNKPRKILVSAPTPAHAATLFSHIKSSLGIETQGQVIDYQGSDIRYIAPDTLLQETPLADLLLIDEAAAIPLPMLSQCLHQYSRVAIATTEHGYEGTGRAFTIRLKQLLDAEQPQWRPLRLTAPMRWADNDPVERALNALFLLDVDPPELLISDDQSQPVKLDNIVVQRLSPAQLLSDEALLRSLFALLLAAHYQTSPNDLARLLDDDSIIVWVGSVAGELVSACVINEECRLSADLSRAVVAGQRRLKGHLLSQSLAAHLGDPAILHQSLWRVERIAVAESYRYQGLGQQLITAVAQEASKLEISCLGVSFGATARLSRFWLKQGFEPIKLGLKRDQASGCYSLQMVKPIKRLAWLQDGVALFRHSLPIQWMTTHQAMEVDIVGAMMCFLSDKPLAGCIDQQIKGFIAGGVGVDASLASLQMWLRQHVKALPSHPDDNALYVLISRIILGHSWSTVCARYGLTGKKQAEAMIRDYVMRHDVSE